MNLRDVETRIKELNSKLYIENLNYCNEIRMCVGKGFIIIATIIDSHIISQITDDCYKYVGNNFEINLFKKLEDYIYG